MKKQQNVETFSTLKLANEYETDLKNGLTEKEAKRRLELFGENKLKEKKKKPWFLVFLSQLNDPMIYVLFAAIAVTIGVSTYETADNNSICRIINLLKKCSKYNRKEK